MEFPSPCGANVQKLAIDDTQDSDSNEFQFPSPCGANVQKPYEMRRAKDFTAVNEFPSPCGANVQKPQCLHCGQETEFPKVSVPLRG